MIAMSRLEVVVAALAVIGGCSGSQTARSDGGRDRTTTSDGSRDGLQSIDQSARDGAPLGTPYPCVGGYVNLDGGERVLASADAGPPVTCVVGQSLCHIYSTDPVGSQPSRDCETVPTGCADNPTCACICGQLPLYSCDQIPCSCDDTGGFVTISCQQI